ncbi:MAG: L,D-transpeptidase YbiS [Cryomorphaceae bacterium]|jgi:L,D-transpeptidase YbiS
MHESIVISINEQHLYAYDSAGSLVMDCAIATAKNGSGQLNGSECTPLGSHRVRAKIGAGQPSNSVFLGRRTTDEIYSEALASEFPQRDWILTRILWLCGNERGLNRGSAVDTQRRYIYIHGAPDSHPMGIPSSHGCVKMHNQDILTLFDIAHVGLQVQINE